MRTFFDGCFVSISLRNKHTLRYYKFADNFVALVDFEISNDFEIAIHRRWVESGFIN